MCTGSRIRGSGVMELQDEICGVRGPGLGEKMCGGCECVKGYEESVCMCMCVESVSRVCRECVESISKGKNGTEHGSVAHLEHGAKKKSHPDLPCHASPHLPICESESATPIDDIAPAPLIHPPRPVP
jgi:hypothetical protein